MTSEAGEASIVACIGGYISHVVLPAVGIMDEVSRVLIPGLAALGSGFLYMAGKHLFKVVRDKLSPEPKE